MVGNLVDLLADQVSLNSHDPLVEKSCSVDDVSSDQNLLVRSSIPRREVLPKSFPVVLSEDTHHGETWRWFGLSDCSTSNVVSNPQLSHTGRTVIS